MRYLDAPAPKAVHRERVLKIDPWKGPINDLLLQDPEANAPVVAQTPQTSWDTTGRARRQRDCARPVFTRVRSASFSSEGLWSSVVADEIELSDEACQSQNKPVIWMGVSVAMESAVRFSQKASHQPR
jgi:hypothetical protein